VKFSGVEWSGVGWGGGRVKWSGGGGMELGWSGEGGESGLGGGEGGGWSGGEWSGSGGGNFSEDSQHLATSLLLLEVHLNMRVHVVWRKHFGVAPRRGKRQPACKLHQV
jgi:hypothetical protein